MVKRVSLLAVIIMGSITLPSFSRAASQCGDKEFADINEIMYHYLGDYTQQWNTKIDQLIRYQETENTRNALVQHFCDTFLELRDDLPDQAAESPLECFSYAGYRYDPRQSMFMYALCGNMDKAVDQPKYKEAFERGNFALADYLTDDLDLNEVWDIPLQIDLDSDTAHSPCDPKLSMQGCQFSRFLPGIFKHIMNDISNIKLASIYGYKYGNDSESRKKAIQEFSESYFGDYTDEQAPCLDPAIWYLNPETPAGDKKHCAHPKTYNLVDETIKSAHKLLQQTDLLDGVKVMKAECEDDQEDLYACAFNSHGSIFNDGDWQVFQNLLMNELMYYNLFVNFYASQILQNLRYNPIRFGSFSFNAQRNQKEVDNLSFELQMSQWATFQMMRMLSHTYVTYPVHVALMAYMEDLINYRKTILKIYTPLHQLYYTLRNTQACQE